MREKLETLPLAQLKELAKAQGISMSDLVRNMILEKLGG